MERTQRPGTRKPRTIRRVVRTFRLKRVYEESERGDGMRILIDRLWPRGLDKETADLDLWMKEIAPSGELRTWFAHETGRWQEFQRRYRDELKDKSDLLAQLRAYLRRKPVTLLFAARDTERNNAVVLKAVLEEEAL